MWKPNKKKVHAIAVLLALVAVFNTIVEKEQVLFGRSLKGEEIDTSDLPCCSPKSKRCVWEKVAPFTIPQCEKQNLLDLLIWLDDVLDVDIEWYITSGTLLGAVREQGHIPFETDIDIVVNREDWDIAQKKIRLRLPETHFTFNDNLVSEFQPARLFFSGINRVHVDIWFCDRISHDIVSEITPKQLGKYTMVNVTSDIIFPLSQCEYDGHSYPCPNQSEHWIELRYGKDWRIPKPKYSPNPLFIDGDDNAFLLGKGIEEKKS